MPKAKSVGVPVSKKALIQRINRKLSASQEMLRVTRGARARMDLGDYFVIDFNRNLVMAHDVDPEQLGRKLGVLHQWERVVS